ncbi:TauD/TfdA family dioxygenase [Frankia sp. KB5]|uniref:(3R)-3-[(carboxymethyl)amino]fatty acid oxygenase/decarboxylase n=1 Tax=Frankia sp. KB5 TaxID=683318 RepID=UPI000A2391D9|nr:TauD/TfdA family dioxygenase [Frankia sp. KB5]ORT53521.1 taurine catabolism dioxygenase [Frankia sp. KB5]
MRTRRADNGFGVVVEGFDPASDAEVAELKRTVYRERIAVLTGQDLDPAAFLRLGRRLGRPEAYYEPIYHHPDVPEVFVSSNVAQAGEQIGVPRTGKFWHSDYQFMPDPFDLTLILPQVVPSRNRGTFFIDMSRAYELLDGRLRAAVEGTFARHSVRRYFKIRPGDVYRPISEVLAEIDERTPAVRFPTVVTHPHSGRKLLYISEGFTQAIEDAEGEERPGLLAELLTASGQLDPTCTHPAIHLQTFDVGDLLVWDNRSLVHRALHTATDEPAVSYRVTVYDPPAVDADGSLELAGAGVA